MHAIPTVLTLLLGCGGKPDSDSQQVTDTGGPCSGDDACPANQICEEQACIVGDRDNAAGEATPLETDNDGNRSGAGYIEPAGDVDWYSFTSEGNQFIRIDSSVDDEDAETDALNTVVTVYDPAGVLLAQEDEHPAGNVGTYDSVVFAWLNDPGTYTFTVEDNAGRDAPGTTYIVTAKDLGAGGDEPDSIQSAGMSLTFGGADLWYSIPVVLTSAGDASDSVLLTVPWSDTQLDFITTIGATGSDLVPQITLYNTDGDVLIDKASPTLESPATLVNSEGLTYVLKVTDAEDGSGATYWGFIFALVREEGYGNDREAETNDTLSVANELAMIDEEPDIGSWIAGFGSGHVDTLEDVDLWKFTVDFDDPYVSVFFGAQDYGGLLDASVDLLSSTGNVVDSLPSNADDDLWNSGPYTAGDYYVRVTSSNDNAAEGEAAFYQLAVHASTSPLE